MWGRPIALLVKGRLSDSGGLNQPLSVDFSGYENPMPCGPTALGYFLNYGGLDCGDRHETAAAKKKAPAPGGTTCLTLLV